MAKTDDQLKIVCQHIRQLAKNGSKHVLFQAIKKIYGAGLEDGMRAMQVQLKERLNDIKSLDPGSNPSGVGGESSGPVSNGGAGANATDAHSSEGSAETVRSDGQPPTEGSL